jgi:hypothetical protein
MNGFLKLERRFFGHWLWQEERAYSRAEAWLDFLQTAAVVPHKRLIAARPVEVPRGGIVASVRFLSDRWMWSNTKVCQFLDALECEGMIRREKRHGHTVILLCCDEFVPVEKRREADMRTTPKRRTDDEDKEREDRKENGETGRHAPATREDVLLFCRELQLPESDADWFWHKGQGNGWTNGGTSIRDWQATLLSWKAARYLPSQKAADAAAVKGADGSSTVKPLSPVESLRKRAMQHGSEEFRRWMRGEFGDRAEGNDDLDTVSRISLLTDFLRAKGERV